MSQFLPSLSLPLASSHVLALARVRRSVPVFAPLLLPLVAGVGRFCFAAYRLVVSLGRHAWRAHHPSLAGGAAPSLASFESPLLLVRAAGVAPVGGSRWFARRGSPVVPRSRALAPKTWQRWSPSGNAGAVCLSGRRCFAFNRQWLWSPPPNPALNRTCAKSRAGRLAPRWASQ